MVVPHHTRRATHSTSPAKPLTTGGSGKGAQRGPTVASARCDLRQQARSLPAGRELPPEEAGNPPQLARRECRRPLLSFGPPRPPRRMDRPYDDATSRALDSSRPYGTNSGIVLAGTWRAA